MNSEELVLKITKALDDLGFKADSNKKAINALGKSIPMGLVLHIADVISESQSSIDDYKLSDKLKQVKEN